MSRRPPWASADPRAPSPDLADLIASGGAVEVTEDDVVARFAFLSGDWPAAFRCTAVDVDSGRLAVWDQEAGVAIERAVASSCSVPGLVPPVTIAGARYMDGGARDMLNADLAIGHERVVAVSCVVLDAPNGTMPELLATLLPAVRRRIDELRASGSTVEVVEPSAELVELSGSGAYLMDHARTAAAFDAGVRQGKEEARRVEATWSA
jgi:NTE family protein